MTNKLLLLLELYVLVFFSKSPDAVRPCRSLDIRMEILVIISVVLIGLRKACLDKILKYLFFSFLS